MAGAGGGHGERSRFPLCDSGESAAVAEVGGPEGYALLLAATATRARGRRATRGRSGGPAGTRPR